MNPILINRTAIIRAVANAGPMTEQQRRAMFARRREQGRGTASPMTQPRAGATAMPRVSSLISAAMITVSGGNTVIKLPAKKAPAPGSRGPAVGSPEWWKQHPEVPSNPGWYVPGGGGGRGLRPAARR